MKDLFLAVGKLSIGIKRIFLLGEKVGLGTLLCLTDLGSLFRTGQNGLQGFQVSVKNRVPAAQTLLFPWRGLHPRLSSLVLVCPSKAWLRVLMETTAVIPLRISAPVKLASFLTRIRWCTEMLLYLDSVSFSFQIKSVRGGLPEL